MVGRNSAGKWIIGVRLICGRQTIRPADRRNTLNADVCSMLSAASPKTVWRRLSHGTGCIGGFGEVAIGGDEHIGNHRLAASALSSGCVLKAIWD
jgi:hypothetical protein